MKIFYKQTDYDFKSGLGRLGLRDCCFKKLVISRDYKSITTKPHHHTGVELHIITDGYQEYEIGKETYRLKEGGFLLIPPLVSHKVAKSSPNTNKISITFNLAENKQFDCFAGCVTDRIIGNIELIENEWDLKKESSTVLIEGYVAEIIVKILRLSRTDEKEQARETDDNHIIILAKQYINDNIENSPTVNEIATYCYLSTKQLTRLFYKHLGLSPGAYIKQERTKVIEQLLADNTLSLKQISEKMNFANEYYFNSYFKKFAGLPPGEYRKMIGK